MKVAIAAIISFSIACLWLTPVAAEDGLFSLGLGSDQPIDIKAKKVTVRNTSNESETIFEGTVRVKQSDMTMNCDQLIVTQDDKNRGILSSINAVGNVEIAHNDRGASAGKVVYDQVKRTITLTESPRLWQGDKVLEAPTIIIHPDKNGIEAPGGKWRKAR